MSRLVDSDNQRWRSRLVPEYTYRQCHESEYHLVIERREWVGTDLLPWPRWVKHIEFDQDGQYIREGLSLEDIMAYIKAFVTKEEAEMNRANKVRRMKPDYFSVEVTRYMPTSSHVEVDRGR